MLLALVGCGASRPAVAGPEPPAPARPDKVRPGGERVADPLPEQREGLPGRCVVACRHLAAVTRADEPPEEVLVWRSACVERCSAHASSGQLDCYERVVRPADVNACATD